MLNSHSLVDSTKPKIIIYTSRLQIKPHNPKANFTY